MNLMNKQSYELNKQIHAMILQKNKKIKSCTDAGISQQQTNQGLTQNR